jgi:hypothetical protein
LFKHLYPWESEYHCEIPVPKTDLPFLYYPYKPVNTKIPKLLDFVYIDINTPEGYRPKIGMPYLMESKENSILFLRFMTPLIQDIKLIDYINAGQTFIFL